MAQRLAALMLAGGLLINVEGHRLIDLDDDDRPYPGAKHIVRLKYMLGLELEWSMYAPEPMDFTGWWVGVGIDFWLGSA